ncbi:hypothetical protein VNO77_05347 [Canavalia gladiata]|uniref:U3 small nucleolar RNA-associated protein 11 n=1 Tax=Canavalia gladiata TaxID=3824 RepID=A0AAN9R9X7_CANGL
MSSLRNAIPRRAHKERPQPSSRKKFGLLEKHKDYVQRARAFHKKEDTLRKLREKAANRNEDEFYFKMVRTRSVDGIHRPESEANKYSQEELMLMKTQDIGYVLQKVQSERKKVERLTATLHSVDNQPPNKHVFFAEDREEAKELQSQYPKSEIPLTSDDIPASIKSLTACVTTTTATSEDSSNTYFIHTSCNTVLYPYLCFSSLSHYAGVVQHCLALLTCTTITITLAKAHSNTTHLLLQTAVLAAGNDFSTLPPPFATAS